MFEAMKFLYDTYKVGMF